MVAKSTPNRRRNDADIDAFGQQAATLQGAQTTLRSTEKTKAYPFRLSADQHHQLRAVADYEERSMQWVFDRIMFPELIRAYNKINNTKPELPGQTNIDQA